MDPFKMYKDDDEAIKDGRDPKSLRELEWRTDEERDALMLAAQYGNRQKRRHFHMPNANDGGPADITRGERDRRNAKNRAARKSRMRNRK